MAPPNVAAHDLATFRNMLRAANLDPDAAIAVLAARAGTADPKILAPEVIPNPAPPQRT
jgi:hypothetical protein